MCLNLGAGEFAIVFLNLCKAFIVSSVFICQS